jgi:Fe-S cluster assembly iron-binding protein IscA
VKSALVYKIYQENGGYIMLVKVTDEAKVKLEEILGQDKSDKALRIYVAAFG